LVDTTAKANFRTLGKRFGKRVQEVAKAIEAADAAALKAALRTDGTAVVMVEGEDVRLGPDEVVLTETPREGWAVASDAGATVALDLHITPELRRAGIARDLIRLIQEARKSSGLDVADRIELRYVATDPEAEAALAEHAALIADEVLATTFGGADQGSTVGGADQTSTVGGADQASTVGNGDADWGHSFADDGTGVTFRLRKA
jgi:isoleucyl-tRNA synthetase